MPSYSVAPDSDMGGAGTIYTARANPFRVSCFQSTAYVPDPFCAKEDAFIVEKLRPVLQVTCVPICSNRPEKGGHMCANWGREENNAVFPREKRRCHMGSILILFGGKSHIALKQSDPGFRISFFVDGCDVSLEHPA